MSDSESTVIPDEVTKEDFVKLSGSTFTESLWNKLHNVEKQTIDQKILLEFFENATDVFLTHDWGTDELGRDNHDRVSRLNTALQARGLTTWFDAERMEGFIQEEMTEGILNTACVIVFITNRYIEKVSGKGLKKDIDNCLFEFRWACKNKGPSKMIPVVMEPRSRDTSNWYGTVASTLSNALYIDYTSDDDFDDVVSKVYDKIIGTIITPIKEKIDKFIPSNVDSHQTNTTDSTYTTTRNIEITSKICDWFIDDADVAPDRAQKYAETLLQKGVPSIKKFARLVQSEGINFFDFDEMDEGDILCALEQQGFLDGCERNDVDKTETQQQSKEDKKITNDSLESKKREKEKISIEKAYFECNISFLIALLHEGTPDGKMEAAEALHNLALDDDIQIKIANEGGIDPLIALVRDGTVDGKVYAAMALCNLAYNADNKAKIANEGGIGALIALVRDGTPDGKMHAAAGLSNLALNSYDNKVKIANEGGIGALITLVRDGTVDGKMYAAAGLSNLAANADNKVKIADEGGIDPLIALVRDGTPGGKIYAATALFNIAFNNADIRVKIVNGGGLKIIKSVYQSEESSEETRRNLKKLLDLFPNDSCCLIS